METEVNVQEQTDSRSYEDLQQALGLKVEPAPQQSEGGQAEKPIEEPIDNSGDVQPAAEAQDDVATDEQATDGVSEDGGGDDPTTSEAEPEQTVFEIDAFNQKFSTDFKDEDDLKQVIEQANRTSELEDQIKELESLKEENLLLKESADPMKYFESEDAFKVQLFRKQFPDKDPAVAYKLFSADLNEVGDVDMIAYKMLLDNPDLDGGLQGAMELVNDKYGIEGDELDSLTKNKVKIEARSARQGISEMKSQIQLPDKVDVDSLKAQQTELREQKTNQLKKGWSDVANEIAKSLPDLVVKDDVNGEQTEVFKYSMTKDFPKEMLDSMVDHMVNSGVEISKDAAGAMIEVAKEKYLSQNFDKIAKAIRDDTLAKADEERLKKQHNPGTPKSQAKPTETKKDSNEQFLSQLRGFQPKKMFG